MTVEPISRSENCWTTSGEDGAVEAADMIAKCLICICEAERNQQEGCR